MSNNQDRNGFKFSGTISLSNVMEPAERSKDIKAQERLSLDHFQKIALFRLLGTENSNKGPISNALEAYFLTPANVLALVESAYRADETLRPTAEDLAAHTKWLESKPVVDSEGSQIAEASNSVSARFAAMPAEKWELVKEALEPEHVAEIEFLRAKVANAETAKHTDGAKKRGRKSALQTLASKANVVRQRNANANVKTAAVTK